jgi:hypothetical protein
LNSAAPNGTGKLGLASLKNNAGLLLTRGSIAAEERGSIKQMQQLSAVTQLTQSNGFAA